MGSIREMWFVLYEQHGLSPYLAHPKELQYPQLEPDPGFCMTNRPTRKANIRKELLQRLQQAE